MTLQEAIKRFADNAEYERTHGNLQGYLDFKQIEEWLRNLNKVKEIMKSSGFKSGKMTIDEIYEEMKYVTLLDIAENLNELCEVMSDIMEVIENE